MNGRESMGFVETGSLVAAIEASDAMVKAARVRLEATHKPGGGRVCVLVYGDLASCQAAVAAGKYAAERCGAFLHCHVLARPDACSEALWEEHIPAMRERKRAAFSRPVTGAGPPVADADGKDSAETADVAPKQRRAGRNGAAK